MLIQRAMVEGKPDEGVLPSGQVAAVIDSLPTVAELIERIVSEAQQRLAALSGTVFSSAAAPALSAVHEKGEPPSAQLSVRVTS
jgi:nitronate monooxygenase